MKEGEGERGRLSVLRKKQFGFLKNLRLKRKNVVTGKKATMTKKWL